MFVICVSVSISVCACVCLRTVCTRSVCVCESVCSSLCLDASACARAREFVVMAFVLFVVIKILKNRNNNKNLAGNNLNTK